MAFLADQLSAATWLGLGDASSLAGASAARGGGDSWLAFGEATTWTSLSKGDGTPPPAGQAGAGAESGATAIFPSYHHLKFSVFTLLATPDADAATENDASS